MQAKNFIEYYDLPEKYMHLISEKYPSRPKF